MDHNDDPVSRAERALYDIQELADSTAEHHPYWALLYNCSQISKLVLEKWNDELTEEDLSEIRWMVSELENSCKKLKNKVGQDSKDKYFRLVFYSCQLKSVLSVRRILVKLHSLIHPHYRLMRFQPILLQLKNHLRLPDMRLRYVFILNLM